MPVRLSDKDPRNVVEPDGTLVKKFSSKEKAKAFVSARNLSERRQEGKSAPPKPKKGS